MSSSDVPPVRIPPISISPPPSDTDDEFGAEPGWLEVGDKDKLQVPESGPLKPDSHHKFGDFPEGKVVSYYRRSTVSDPMFKPPHLRQFFEKNEAGGVTLVREESDRKAAWIELYYDLSYVAAVALLSHSLQKHFDAQSVVIFIAMFFSIYVSWHSVTMYLNRYDSHDIIHKIFLFLLMPAVLGFGVAADTYEPKLKLVYFCSAFLIARGLLVSMYLYAAFSADKGHRVFPLSQALLLLFNACVWWVTSLLLASMEVQGWQLAPFLWICGVVIDMLIGILPGVLDQRMFSPVSIEHLSERLGLFIVLILGEMVVAAFIGDAASLQGTDVGWLLGQTYLDITPACLFQLLYFDMEQHSKKTMHAVRRNKFTGVLWVHLHMILSISLATAGLSSGIMHDESSESLFRSTICFAYALSLLSLSAMRMCHKCAHTKLSLLSVSVRVIAMVFLCLFGVYYAPQFLSIVVQAVCVGMLFIVTCCEYIVKWRMEK